jgi:CHAT domain-containing protein/Tfp pilus assembly protein PilF
VVVEEVARNAGGEKAGLKPGDLLLSWVRAPAPPANPEEARGEIGSPFDLADIEMEQAPRGDLTLLGTRDGARFSVVVPPGTWGITARPHFAERWLLLYQEGKDLIAVKEIDKGVATWSELSAQASKANDLELAGWLLLRVADTLATPGRWDEAHSAYQVALGAAKKHGEPRLVAKVWDAEAGAFQRRNKLPEAEAAYRESLQIREGNPTETLAVATSLTNLGAVAFGRGDLAAAEESFRKALALRERLAPVSLEVASSLNSLGVVARNRGDLVAAEQFYMRSLAIRQKLSPEGLDVARLLTNLGVVARDRGDLAAAEELHTRSLAMKEKLVPDSPDVAASLTNLGIVAENRGDLVSADRFFRRSLALREKFTPATLEVAGVLNNLGVVAARRGDLVAAEEFARRALAIREKLAPVGLDVAASLHNLAAVAAERGDLAAAGDFYSRALAIRQKLAPESVDVAVNLTNLGTVALQRHDLTGANELHKRSLAIASKIAPDSLDVARSLNNLGVVATARGDLIAAEEFYRRALGIREKLAPASLDVAVSLTNVAEVATERGDLQAAETNHKAALALRQKLAPASTVEAKSLYNLGMIARRRGQRAASADYLQQAIAALEAQTGRLGGAEEVRSGFTAQYIDYYRDYMDLLLEMNQLAQAFNVLERSRARSLLTMLTERDLTLAADLSPDLTRERTLINADYDRTQAAIARLNPAKDAAEIDRLLARLRELRDKREQTAETIRRTSPRFASLHYPQPLDVAGAQQSLDARTVLLAYCVTKEKTFLFVVQPSGRQLVRAAAPVSVFAIPIGETALREKVAAFRRLIQRGGESGEHSPVPILTAGHELFETLVKPAQSFIAASDRVLISPDGPLHMLPFAVLAQPADRSTRTDRYFIEWKPIHVVASATVYAELRKARPNTGDTAQPVVLAAFGDPTYPRWAQDGLDSIANPEVRAVIRSGYALASLPASRKEVEGIARLYAGSVTKYLGADATEDRAKAIGKGVRYLHFASHGLLDERFPLNSALALTIPETPAEGQANGLLQAWEVFEQMRIDADLVTLSACETGLGKEMGGEGLVGLTRAFQYAGARTVLASLWSVGDDSTAELMTRFYGHLKAGKAKDEALRAAQIEFIRRRASRATAQGTTSAGLHQPFHWAAFQLVGDWK